MPTGVYKRTEWHFKKLRLNWLGNKSPGRFKKGHSGYWNGKKMPKWIGKKMSKSRSGEKNYKFKGELAVKRTMDIYKYHNLHRWVETKLGKPKICENCGTNRSGQFDWANISHKYKKILSDWKRLCNSCHQRYDNGKIKI